MLTEKTVKAYIEAAASGEPTPGGGSVGALAGSLGAALTSMVANLSFGKKAYEGLDQAVKSKFEEDHKKVVEKIEKMTKIIDEDAHAFDEVMEAFKLPKSTDEEKAARSKAIAKGYMTALEVPKLCAELCLETLKLQKVFAENGNKNAITDVGVGALLLYAGLESCLLNVKINLGGVKDDKFVEETNIYMDEMLKEANALKEETLKIVYSKI